MSLKTKINTSKTLKSKLAHPDLKVALVYDRVNTPFGGAEQVLLQLHQIFPSAPLFTSVCDTNRAHWAEVFTIKTSFLQKIPFLRHRHRLIPWLMPLAYELIDFSNYDLIISVSSAEAKGIITKPNQLHVCYLLTPPRYLYSHWRQALETLPSLIRPLAFILMKYLKWWDQVAISRPDVIIPISKLVKARISKFYPNSSLTVTSPLYPPVSLNQISVNDKSENQILSLKKICQNNPKPFLLCFGRLVPYKEFDLVIKASSKLNQDLVIIGEGPHLKKLKKLQRQLASNCIFLPHLPQEELLSYILNAKAIIFPAEEDFGISQVEVALLKKPLILNQNSGAFEVLKSLSEVYPLTSSTLADLIKTISSLDDSPASDSMNIKSDDDLNQLKQYDSERFRENFIKTINFLNNSKNYQRSL
jgi:glycosyltransferase involved in cell wall biosynthesis